MPFSVKTKTTREQVKFLVTRAIGAAGRKVNKRKLSPDDKKWLESDFIITKEERKTIEAAI